MPTMRLAPVLLAVLMYAPECAPECAPGARAADPWANARTITEVMVDNSFQPDHLTFHSGQPYALRLENHGKDMHEFTAPDFLRAATIRDRGRLANGGTDIVVQPGQSVTVFLIPGPKGEYDLHCADHDWDGMVGSITVN
jgi:uncharacterized cupredoxin-like copper-binding protein